MSNTCDPVTLPLATLLWWDGARGEARHNGVSVLLDSPPAISTVRLVRLIHFSPAEHMAEIRESGQARRSMTQAEIAEVMAHLDELSVAAHHVNGFGPPVPAVAQPIAKLPPSASWDLLMQKLRDLPEREQLVASLRFEHGITDHAVIAAALHKAQPDAMPPWTEAEVDLIYAKALDALRDALADTDG